MNIVCYTPRGIKEHFQVVTASARSKGRFELPSRFPFRGSSERKYDREYDDEYAGTDHSNYLPVVVVLAIVLSL